MLNRKLLRDYGSALDALLTGNETMYGILCDIAAESAKVDAREVRSGVAQFQIKLQNAIKTPAGVDRDSDEARIERALKVCRDEYFYDGTPAVRLVKLILEDFPTD